MTLSPRTAINVTFSCYGYQTSNPISMYDTTTSIVIIVHYGVTGSADANSITLKCEGPPLIQLEAIFHSYEMMLNHNTTKIATDTQPQEPQSNHYDHASLNNH